MTGRIKWFERGERYHGDGRAKQNIINYLINLLICLNIIFFVWVIFSKRYHNQEVAYSNTYFYQQIERAEFEDEICPDMELITSENQAIKLSELGGKVILIKFSKFDDLDYPSLVYLDHIQNKLSLYGLHTIYISMQSLNKKYGAFAPLVYDDGFISNIFKARAGDTILVDREFKLRLKNNNVPNYFLYRQICRLLFSDELIKLELEDKEVANLLKMFSFINIENREVEKIEEAIKKWPSILLVGISQCYSCQEHKRITLLKEMARLSKGKVKILLLFGKGNDIDSTKTFAIRNKLFAYMKIGILQAPDETEGKKYYELFDLAIDPRIIIYNDKSKPIFIENKENRKSINSEYIRELLGL